MLAIGLPVHTSRAIGSMSVPDTSLTDASAAKPVVGTPADRAARISPQMTALIVASALFMEQLDGTVLATALPTMARSFDVDPLHMNVALTSYLLSLAVFIPASGKAADRFGSRTVFRGAIALFTVGSVLCAQAPSLWFLVGARILQGIGGAMMVPVGRLVLLRSVSKADLVAAMAWLMIPATIGPILGPPGRRLHCLLPRLAMDLLHQRADRRAGHRAGDAVHSRRCASRGAQASISSACCSPASPWRA